LRIYNRYVVSLVLACCLINTLLAFLGRNDLEIYLTINIVAYLVITLLYVSLNPRVRRALNPVGAVLFAGFIVMVVVEVLGIVLGG